MPKSQVRAVFFDIGNVLLHFDAKEILRRFAFAVGRPPKGLNELLWAGRLVDRLERGKLSSRHLYKAFQDLGYSGTYPEFRGLWCGIFTLDRPTEKLLERTARKVPVYLLSNTNELHYEHIKKSYSFPGRTRGALLSHRLGVRKPEAAIYEAALRRARVLPQEALFIDDLPKNVAGARRSGLQAVLYRGAKNLARSLRARGVL
ncbi:MAG: HAD family phosphatase [Elusimicrobiota bacterium]|jgi:putative hydrolase of the HAD superfamily